MIQVWFQNRRSKEKRDASYRETMKDETHLQSGAPVHVPSTVPAPVDATGWFIQSTSEYHCKL